MIALHYFKFEEIENLLKEKIKVQKYSSIIIGYLMNQSLSNSWIKILFDHLPNSEFLI